MKPSRREELGSGSRSFNRRKRGSLYMMRSELIIAERSLTLLMVVLLVSISILACPYLRSAFYLHQGKRTLDGALYELGVNSTEWNELVSHPINPNVDGFIHKAGLAAGYLRQAVAADPRNAEAYRALGMTYFALGEGSAALEALTSASEVRPRNPATHLAMGDVYDGLGLAERAVAEYERGRYGPRIERAVANYLKLAESRLKAGDPNSALPLLLQVISWDGSNLYASYQLAKIYETLGEGEALLAEEIYRRIHHFTPQSIEPRQDRRLDQFTAAIIPGLIEDHIWSLDDALNVISFWIWQGEQEVAKQTLGWLMETHPAQPQLHYYQGQLSRQRGEPQEAIDALQTAIGLSAQFAPACLEMARTYETTGDLTEALSWYERCHRMAPQDLLSLKKVADLYQQIGELEAAARWREELKARTGVNAIVAEVLGVEGDELLLGPNLIENAGFEQGGTSPLGWDWSLTAGTDVWNEAAFFGGVDSSEVYEGERSARVEGFWTETAADREGGRAGYWAEEVELGPNTLWVLSFYYRTWDLSDGDACVWVSPEPEVIFAHDHGLPATDGAWRKAVIVGWNKKSSAGVVKPLLRNWGVGGVWFDDVGLRQIRVQGTTEPMSGETIFILR